MFDHDRHARLLIEELEDRVVPTLLGQQLFPSDYPWNQNISNAPVAANSAAIINHIGSSIGIHPDWGEDSASNGASPLYGIPYNVVHGNATAKVNVIIDNYPGESDIVPVPIPANAVIEGDYQNGPNPNGGGYNANQRGDSHMIIWDEDNNIAYELYGVTRPTDPTLFPDTNGDELPHTDGLWHAAQESVWYMGTDGFRPLGNTSADAAGLSILAGLARPDEGLPVSQGGQGAIDHALRLTLPSGDVAPQYIYPASHVVSVSSGSTKLPFGARLRLENTPAVNAVISTLGPEAQVIAHAMQQYGLVLADIGSAMYVTGASSSQDANNNIDLTWNMDDVLGLHSLTAGDFQVVDLTPQVASLSATNGSAHSTITLTGQNFSGSAGHLTVFFGTTASPSVTYIDDAHITAVVPSGTGTVPVTVQSGVNETDPNNPSDNVTAPIFGYGTSTATAADQFTFSSQLVSGADSTVRFASSSVRSSATDLVTIVVKDAAGNAVSGLASSAFAFGLSGGTSTGSFGAVSETTTKGTYTSSFTGTSAGSASTLTATVTGITLTSQPTVTVTAGAVSSAKSTVSMAAPRVVSGGTDPVTIVVKDSAGNAVGGLAGSAFRFTLTVGTSRGTISALAQTSIAGTYTAIFTATTVGTTSTLTAIVNGIPLATKPTVQVLAKGVSSANSKVSVALPTLDVGQTDLVTVVVKDRAVNPINGLAGSAFRFKLSGGTSSGTFGTVTETTTPGTYTALFTATKAGTVSTLTCTVSDVSLASKPTITVSSAAAAKVTAQPNGITAPTTTASSPSVPLSAGSAMTLIPAASDMPVNDGSTELGFFGFWRRFVRFF